MKARRRVTRKITEMGFVGLFLVGIVIALAILGVLLGAIVTTAWPFLGPQLITNFPEFRPRFVGNAGYSTAIVGTLWVVSFTLLFSLPLGFGAGIYLQEFAGRSRLASFLQTGVSNLAGVPSVVFGLLGLTVFSQALRLGPSILTGALTLTILVFPYVVITAQEAIRAVPQTIRDAALAMGATKWQAIRQQVLPGAAPGLLTASILAASRTIGETAPLIVIQAVIFMTFFPTDPLMQFSALPVQIYQYIESPPSFRGVAAGGMVILLAILFAFNALAIIARNRLQRQRW